MRFWDGFWPVLIGPRGAWLHVTTALNLYVVLSVPSAFVALNAACAVISGLVQAWAIRRHLSEIEQRSADA